VTVTAPFDASGGAGSERHIERARGAGSDACTAGIGAAWDAEKSPLAARVLRVSATFSLFVRVIVCAALVVATGCAEKVRLVGDMITGRTAVPETLKTC